MMGRRKLHHLPQSLSQRVSLILWQYGPIDVKLETTFGTVLLLQKQIEVCIAHGDNVFD